MQLSRQLIPKLRTVKHRDCSRYLKDLVKRYCILGMWETEFSDFYFNSRADELDRLGTTFSLSNEISMLFMPLEAVDS